MWRVRFPSPAQMRKFLLISFLLLSIAVFLAYSYYFKYLTQKGNRNNTFIQKISYMILKSPAFENEGLIPAKYTCDGININPPLNISDVSTFAKSLVLIVEDPDSPSGDFTHWIIFNIDPGTSFIDENSVPSEAKEGINDFGQPNYGGPCPNIGEHRYVFELYSLDNLITLERGTAKKEILKTMEGHILEQKNLIGKYKMQ